MQAMTAFNGTDGHKLQSWVEDANDPQCDFPIQNLPYGVFSTRINPEPRIGVAIGRSILDLSVLQGERLLPAAGDVFRQRSLNAFIALGQNAWSQVRKSTSALLAADCSIVRDNAALRSRALVPMPDSTLHVPIEVAGFTD